MRAGKSYNEYVSGGIIFNNKLGISAVNNLEDIKSILFNREKYCELIKLFQSGDIEAMKGIAVDDNSEPFQEFLDIMSFEDQNNKKYIVTIYDSTELLQDPEIIDIFQL